MAKITIEELKTVSKQVLGALDKPIIDTTDETSD